MALHFSGIFSRLPLLGDDINHAPHRHHRDIGIKLHWQAGEAHRARRRANARAACAVARAYTPYNLFYSTPNRV